MNGRKCWAESLGGCSDKLSGEHIVTAGLFSNDLVAVQGLPWCKDEPKTIGLNNLTRKILCTYHNSNSSPLDQAAIAAFKAFQESVRLTDAREEMKERRWTVVHIPIDGNVLERWFLKTLINLTVGGNAKIGPKSETPGEPSKDLIEIVYGISEFVPNAGLYNSAELGETIQSEDRVNIAPFFDADDEHVMGGHFHFRGFRFMLCLAEKGFTGTLTLKHRDGRTTQHSKPLRHLEHVKVTIGPSQKYVSHFIDLKWKRPPK